MFLARSRTFLFIALALSAALGFFQSSMDPYFVDARMNLANTLFLMSRFDDAIAQINELLRQRPNYPPALAALEKLKQQRAASPLKPPEKK